MNQIRFIISIVANLLMIGIGGFLTFLGVGSLFAFLKIYLFLEQEVPGSGQTMNESLGALGGGPFDFFADLTPWFILAGKLLGGIALLVFGGMGLLRRLRAGMPDEDEGVAETAGGRTGNVLVYGAGGLVGFYLLASVLWNLTDYLSLRFSGERAVAVIEKNWKSKGAEDEEKGRYYITYRFETAAGQTFESKKPVPTLDGRPFREGNRIGIIYLPANPGINEWERLRSFSDYVLPLLFYSLLLFGGVWGVNRNLGGGESEDYETS